MSLIWEKTMSRYKRDDKEFKARLAQKADEKKLVTLTIDENGDVLSLATELNDIFLDHADVVTKRASHVEPTTLGARLLFHFLRLFGDKTQLAEWTRTWQCNWRVNTKPVGGPILLLKHVYPVTKGSTIGQIIATWPDRQEAIEAEVKFLNNFFLEREL